MKTDWVAKIEGENGMEIKVGIQKREDERFEIVGKLPNGTVENADQIDDTYEMALDSIGIMYGGDTWKLQWIDKYTAQKKYMAEKLKKFEFRMKPEIIEEFKEKTKAAGSNPTAEIKKFILNYIDQDQPPK
ncbi:MAG: hypothetical protein PWQ06_122 [Anaerophaga sp.]|nr:hypothetical protein [Anaerophaga sp.]